MKKVLGTIFLVIYSIIAVAVTILLLSYNEYMCSEVNGYTVYIVRDETLEPDFVKGDLLFVKKTDPEKLEVGDKLFLYQNISDSEYRVRYGTLTEQFAYGARTIYNIDNEYQFDSTYLMGSDEGLIVYHKWGTVLSLLTSRWGYLFCIVIVTLLLFLEELYELFMEIKYGDEMDDDDDDDYYDEDDEYEDEEDDDETEAIEEREVKRTKTPRKTPSAKTTNTGTTKTAKTTSTRKTTGTKSATNTKNVKTTKSTPKANSTKSTTNARKTSSTKTTKNTTTVKKPKDPKEKV